ncbi:MAG: hypothetical protein JW860_09625 [Sedimentisphaerales bacterium]|nr:hypothetical protein [Sedimentisphaerales bacterium]
MAEEYSVAVCKQLQEHFQGASLHRPMRIGRYDGGDELTYEVTGVVPDNQATVRVKVNKFVGGGFAGQVYQVRVLEQNAPEGIIKGLEPGAILAMKILIPPSGFSLMFRNIIYGIGFQGPFQLQVNPAAARAGALWQKFIQRGAKIQFGDERTVRDIYATFVDTTLGSCGELSDWIEGRTWLLEVDDHIELLKPWRQGKTVDTEKLGSPEYRAKYTFMTEFVKLLHEMGAPEFARQYEWSTCKSQPNCLKRYETENEPEKGLVAVDFRAGLALLPFLPMSPGDFKLIINGIKRGSLVQFDRGSLTKLEQYMNAHDNDFSDMNGAFEQLKQAEDVYRDSLPDITHNHVRLLYSRKLWSTLFSSAVNGWRVRNIVDESGARNLSRSRLATIVFFIMGLIPFLGKFVRRIWGRADYRKHYSVLFSSWDYFGRALRGRVAEKVTLWYRAGRINQKCALKITQKPTRYYLHLPLSILPAGLHRLLTDRTFAREKLVYIFVRPIRLYFNADLREQWLRDMVREGRKKHLVTDEDADIILSRIGEPFIQKYLKSLAVHVCTLPVTQVVSVMIAIIYYLTHREDPNAWKVGLGIIAAFQITPISPGSLCRGLYTLYLVISERNFKDYNIAVFLSFFKYVGYLAFPIQMAYRYPVLARFMASHWATEAVHVVPVFGEKGALLEHEIFSLFYNRPLTIRRRMAQWARYRATQTPRSWHVVPIVIIAVLGFIINDYWWRHHTGVLPLISDIWWLSGILSLLIGAAITMGAGGSSLGRRMILAVLGGILAGFIFALIHGASGGLENHDSVVKGYISVCLWLSFIFGVFSTLGAVLAEIFLPEMKR